MKINKSAGYLLDSTDNKIEVNKEVIHFDRNHIKRIEWIKDKLPDFKKALPDITRRTIQ
jgi:hypothetical protein